MARQKHEVAPHKLHCLKCHQNAVGTESAVGRKHKGCPRPASNPKRRTGYWISGNFEIIPTASGRKCECSL